MTLLIYFAVITLKFEKTNRIHCREMHLKDADRITNSADIDHTVPLTAI